MLFQVIAEKLKPKDLPDNLECRPCYQRTSVIDQMRFSDDFVSTEYSVMLMPMLRHNAPSEIEIWKYPLAFDFAYLSFFLTNKTKDLSVQKKND